MTKKTNQFLGLYNRRLNILLYQHRSKFFPIGRVLVDELAEYRIFGFALAFDRHAKSPAFNLEANSSNCFSEISWSLLFKFVTNLFKPWEILTHEWELSLFKHSILIPTPFYLVGNWLWLPTRVQFWCSLWSNPSVQMFLHLLAKCTHDKPLHLWIVKILKCLSSWKYCPISTTVRDPASIQNLLLLSPTPFLRSLMLRICERASSAGTIKKPSSSPSRKRILSWSANTLDKNANCFPISRSSSDLD